MLLTKSLKLQLLSHSISPTFLKSNQLKSFPFHKIGTNKSLQNGQNGLNKFLQNGQNVLQNGTNKLLQNGQNDLQNGLNSLMLPRSFSSFSKRKYEMLRHVESGHNHGSHHTLSPSEKALAEKVTIGGLFVNIGMTIFKATCGYIGNSSAMLADAGHSAGDLVSDFVTLGTLKFARRPGDAQHPYGYGKFESVGALTVAGLLIVTGFGLIHHTFEHFLNPAIPSTLALWAAGLSIVFKEIVYQYTSRIGKKQNSQLLLANAWHHRADVVSSFLAFVGIGASQIGFTYGDPLAGVAVALLIIRMGVKAGWESLKELTDTVSNPTELQEMSNNIMNVPGVKNCLRIRSRKMGTYSHVDCTVEVDPLVTVSAAHQIGERVRQFILSKYAHVYDALVHVIPESQHDTKLLRSHASIDTELDAVVKEFPEIQQISHISYHFLNDTVRLEINILADIHQTIEQVQSVATRFQTRIEEKIPEVSVADIHIDLDPTS